MTTFTIEDSALDQIKDQVVLITGASSGIGLATLRRVIKHGGLPYASDLNALPSDLSSVPFTSCNVTSWAEQVALFKAAFAHYGRIDHVFANAGIMPTISLLEEDVDENGDLLPPKMDTMNVNLTGCMYTCKLAIWYLRRNGEKGGSIAITASASSFTRFPPTDYTTSKHGVFGLSRALTANFTSTLPQLRCNAIAPSWTATGIVPSVVLSTLGEGNYQTADVPARSIVYLFANKSCHGQLVYSDKGVFVEMEDGDMGYHEHTKRMLGYAKEGELTETALMKKMEVMQGVKDMVDANNAQKGEVAAQ